MVANYRKVKFILSLMLMTVAACLAGSGYSAAKSLAAPAETSDFLKQLVRDNSYELRVDNGKLSGPASDKIFAAAKNAQFVVLAEEHMVKEIPEITTMLLSELHDRYGFNHLASETGTVQAEMMSESPLVGNSDAVFSWTRSHPESVTFLDDQEVQMFADTGRIWSKFGRAIWGLDQEFGTLHVFERLVQIAPNAAARESAEQLRAAASKKEKKRSDKDHFIVDDLKPEQLQALRNAFRPEAGSEADHLLGAVETSSEIYRAFKTADMYKNNFEREQYMKQVFLNEYRRAQSEGENQPRVVIKAGHWHALRGLGPSHMMSTGTFLDDMAFEHGMDCYIIAIHSNGPSGAWRRIDYPELKQVGDILPNDKWMLLDLRALRPYEAAGKLKDINPYLRQQIYQADALLILGGDHKGTEDQLRGGK